MNLGEFHQVSSKSDEKKIINSPVFCSEFQSVSRVVKIVHSALGLQNINLNFPPKFSDFNTREEK